MWQELRAELHPLGLEVVTVALDTGGVDAAGRFIDRAKPEHPALIDEAHLLDELLGVTNVPMGTWIDEDQTIVRPPEVAFPGRVVYAELLAERGLPDDAPQYLRETLAESAKIRATSPRKYVAALRDWAANGAESSYALAPDEVVARSQPRPAEASAAAAHFELGQHLHRTGEVDAARSHFREAHRLAPENWTYKRQAWSLVDPLQGPTEFYDGDWLSDIRRLGHDSYYPRAEL